MANREEEHDTSIQLPIRELWGFRIDHRRIECGL